MAQSAIDKTLQRVVVGDYAFPLGVCPAATITPTEGYVIEFEPADGGDGGDWEEWPDRYLIDVSITATRLPTICRMLFSLLPGRIYPILDVLGNDAYREVDPYIAYDLVGTEHFIDGLRRHAEWLYDDGLVGFGAMSDDPFMYIYVDEHKMLTIRVEAAHRERVERVLAAFDLSGADNLVTVDTVSHEHRSVLLCPPERPDLMTGEELLEELMDHWRLRLNVDRERNLDDDGRPLGLTGWRCLLRRISDPEKHPDYAEAIIVASCFNEAEALALDAAAEDSADADDDDASPWPRNEIVVSDRLRPEQIAQLLDAEDAEKVLQESGVCKLRWLPANPEDSS